jgi:hypothetical protein
LILPDFTQRFDASYPDAVIHRAVAGWSADLGVEAVDSMPLFQGQDHTLFMILTDGHPNARAHEIIAGVLCDRVIADLHLVPAAAAKATKAAGPAVSSGRR